jgi:hypothetical protein
MKVLAYLLFVCRSQQVVVVPEWLSGMTRNHVGSARAGSNPADHASIYFFLLFFPFLFKSDQRHLGFIVLG